MVSMNKVGVNKKGADLFEQQILVSNRLAYDKLIKDYNAVSKGRNSIFETYEQIGGSIIATMVDRVDETFKNRLLGEDKYVEGKNEGNPIKVLDAIQNVCHKPDMGINDTIRVLDAIQNVCHKPDMGINDTDDEMLTTKKFLNMEHPGKQSVAAWSKVVEANFNAVVRKCRVF